MSRSASTPRHEFWLSHRRRAKAERMSLRAYAQREGLSLASLYAARPAAPRSSSVLPPVGPTGFAAVRVSGAGGCELSLPGGMTLRLPEAPSATWLATFLRALAS